MIKTQTMPPAFAHSRADLLRLEIDIPFQPNPPILDKLSLYWSWSDSHIFGCSYPFKATHTFIQQLVQLLALTFIELNVLVTQPKPGFIEHFTAFEGKWDEDYSPIGQSWWRNYTAISSGLTSCSIRLPVAISACFRSNELCRLSQNCAVVPKQRANRSAVSGEWPGVRAQCH